VIPSIAKPSAQAKILAAAVAIVRAKGYAGTTADELCAAARVTKGAFFHHFASKEHLAVAAADHWSETTNALFAAAPYHAYADPLDRVLGYIKFRKALLKGAVPEFTCLVGTMVQEAYGTHPAIRVAVDRSISSHAAKVEADIAEAMQKHGLHADWTAKDLALHTQAVLQGAFILAKAKGGAEVAADSLDHLRRYVELLFGSQGIGSKRIEEVAMETVAETQKSVRILADGLLFGESPRWRDGALWVSDWGASEVLRFDAAGRREVIARVASFPMCIEHLPDGRLLIVDSARKPSCGESRTERWRSMPTFARSPRSTPLAMTSSSMAAARFMSTTLGSNFRGENSVPASSSSSPLTARCAKSRTTWRFRTAWR
jgi:TetR/AcrR family transcriptional repressor of nem operon